MTDNPLPFPPLEMRELVGPTDTKLFDNPDGKLVFPQIPVENYEAVLDFGCGCGRIARQLIQQNPQPKQYLGLDLHRGMIRWCQNNLTPHAPQFEFRHHDVYNIGFNPKSKAKMLPFGVEPGTFTLVNTWSVFTHLLEDAAAFYMKEISQALRPDGLLLSTWFIFDKRYFPMMQTFQNALYINTDDPTNAVIFDREWIQATAKENGLTIVQAFPPRIRGFAWILVMSPDPDAEEAEIAEDLAPFGRNAPPVPKGNPSSVG